MNIKDLVNHMMLPRSSPAMTPNAPRFDTAATRSISVFTQGCPTSGAEISRQAGATGGAMTLEPDPGHAGGGTGRRHRTQSLVVSTSAR